MSACIGECGKARWRVARCSPTATPAPRHHRRRHVPRPPFAAWRSGVRSRVLADETRPLLQGARLTPSWPPLHLGSKCWSTGPGLD